MAKQANARTHEGVGWQLTRSSVATAVLIAAFVVAASLNQILPVVAKKEYRPAILAGLAVIALIAGVIAIRGWLGLIFQRVDRQAAVVLRNLGAWALYACLVLALLSLLGVNLSGLLVGGAIAGVVIGAAAQSSLGNFFAGILLMVVRPFEVGVTLRLRTSIAGTIEFEGTVVDTNALYTTLRTPKGELLRLPNQVVLNSALTVGRPPLQGTLQAQVPSTLPLAILRTRIKEQLPDRGAQVVVTPMSVAPAAEGTGSLVLCQIDVRSRRQLDESAFAGAVTAALAPSTAPAPPTPT